MQKKSFHLLGAIRQRRQSGAHFVPPQKNLTEWSFGDTEADRAELVLQTDVRVNISGERFLSQAHFQSQPPLRPPRDSEYEPGASKRSDLSMAPRCSNVGEAKPHNVRDCVSLYLYVCENPLVGNHFFATLLFDLTASKCYLMCKSRL